MLYHIHHQPINMNGNTKTNNDYRRILDTVNKLEVIQSNLDSVIDFFSAPIVKLYSELLNDCSKLLFETEFKLDHYRMAEEFIWKQIYHEIYRFQKTKKQRLMKNDERLIESHFISGIGFYSTLVVRLRIHYKIHDVPGVISPLNLTLGPLDNFVDNQRLNEDDTSSSENDDNLMYIGDWDDANLIKAKDWARQAIYRSLVYMGDLARYLMNTSESDYRKLAFDFYCSASRFQPDNGLPFNQLATLAGGLNHSLDSVCSYMRCCLRPIPFDRAEGNMRQIFELNKNSYAELHKEKLVSTISDVLASRDPGAAAESMMRAIIVTFIKLTSNLWNAISSRDDEQQTKDKFIEEVVFFFKNLREALELETIVPLTSLTKVEQEFWPISGGSSFEQNPRHVSPTIMYEFCSISIMLLAQCQKQRMPKESCDEQPNDYIVDLINTLALNLLYYSTSKCQKMVVRKIRELSINSQEQLMDDLSEAKIDHLSGESQEFESILAYIYTQTHLPTIKIFCDWLLSNGSIISSNLDSFHTFHAELTDMVKTLNDLKTMSGLENPETSRNLIYRHIFNGPTWLQKYPLSCDFPLFNLTPLKNVHMLNIYFNYQRDLSDAEAGFLSIQCLEAFLEALTVFLENRGHLAR